MQTKRCTKCKCDLPATLEYFHSDGGNSKAGLKAQCKQCRKQEWLRKLQTGAVPTQPVPEGFDVRTVATQVDEDGAVEKQWIDAKPTREVHAGLQEAVPGGHYVKGVSTLVDESGNVVAQWIKTNTEQQAQHAALVDALKHIADAWDTRAEPSAAPELCRSDLLCVYPMGDPHIGMFAWAEEAGDNFDLKIAERNLVDAVDQLVECSPPAAEALIINLGDYFHTDNASNQTSRSHNVLDVDTRWGKMLRVGIRTMRRCIDKALAKHERVRVICEIGNHDDHSSIMLALCLEQYYENEPRVSIDTSPARFHWYRFGATLIGVTHGHTVKLAQLPGIMACDRKADWGETDHRFWYTGHVHHDSVQEFPGVTVETFRTLAPKDAWTAGAGHRAGRDMKCDVIHIRDGRVQRNIVGISQLRE